MPADASQAARALNGPVALRAIPVGLVLWAFLAMALDIGVARLTYGVALPALRRDLGLSLTAGGVLSAVNLAAYLAGTLAAPWLGKRFGMPSLVCVAHLGFGAGALLSGVAVGPVALGVGRILMGLGAGAGIVALFAVVFAATRSDMRSAVSAFVWSGIGFAVVASGLAVPWILRAEAGWRAAFILSAAMAVAVGLRFRPNRVSEPAPAPMQEPRAAASGAAAYRSWTYLFAAYFMFGLAYIAYATFAGAQLQAIGASQGRVIGAWVGLGSATMSGAFLGGIVLRKPGLNGFALVFALLCGSAGALAAGMEGAVGPLLGAGLVGLGLASTPAIVTSYVRERTTAAEYAQAFSFATASLGAGQLVGPVLAGWLADLFGTDAATKLAALAYGLGALAALADRAGTRAEPN